MATPKKKNYGKGKKGAPSRSAKDVVVSRIIETIQSEQRLPWERSSNYGCFNAITAKSYRGLNLYLLGAGSGEYLTYNQLKDYNEKHKTNFFIKKGSKAFLGVFSGRNVVKLTEDAAKKLIDAGKGDYVKDDGENGKHTVKSTLSFFNVFDRADVTDSEGKEFPSILAQNPEIKRRTDIEDVIKTYMKNEGIQYTTANNTNPHYLESTDTVSMPDIKNFVNMTRYYATLAHELVHTTGVTRRLNRKCFNEYHGATPIAGNATESQRNREELVAEIGSWIFRSHFDLPDDGAEQASLAYINSWCQFMKDNPNEVIQGFKEAERAVNYILEGGKKGSAQPKAQENNSLHKHLYKCLDFERRNERAHKVKERFIKNNLAVYITTQLGFKAKAVRFQNFPSATPVFIYKISDNYELYVGYTFAFIVEHLQSDEKNDFVYAEDKVTDLFQIGRNATLQYAQEVAKKYEMRIPTFPAYVALLGLNNKLPVPVNK